jgi:peptidoglycan/LPS O-acetylase OafA/YrhL
MIAKSRGSALRLAYADVLRVAAIAVVVLDHFWIGLTPSEGNRFAFDWMGVWGVNAFFVLSAFLLSGPFLASALRPNAVAPSTKRFFVRRVLRIYPLYVASVLFSAALLFISGTPTTVQDTIMHLFLLHDLSLATVQSLNGPLWTMPVHVCFYVLLPLAMCLFANSLRRASEPRRLTAMLVALACVVVGGIAFRAAVTHVVLPHIHGNLAWSFVFLRNIFGMAPDFAIGILLAIVIRRRATSTHQLTPFASGAMLLTAALFTLASGIMLYATQGEHPVLPYVFYDLPAGASVGLVLFVLSETCHNFVNLTEHRVTQYLATLSTAVYFVHLPVLLLVLRYTTNLTVQIVLAMFLTICCALVAHYAIERPFLRIRDSSRETRPAKIDITRQLAPENAS